MGWLRNPKTYNEKRAAGFEAWLVRPARRSHNLPSAWDDFIKPAVKTWKAYRTTQYRTINK